MKTMLSEFSNVFSFFVFVLFCFSMLQLYILTFSDSLDYVNEDLNFNNVMNMYLYNF